MKKISAYGVNEEKPDEGALYRQWREAEGGRNQTSSYIAMAR